MTLLWTFSVPFIQHTTPAALVASTLQEVLGEKISEYAYVDFCAGAGGPTPFIEQDLNLRLRASLRSEDLRNRTSSNKCHGKGTENGVDFVLTDIAPHLDAWEQVVKKSDNLHFISTPVDAANVPSDLLQFLPDGERGGKVFRLFNLAFHHFDDPLAKRILYNSITTSDGFGIFELQARTFSSLLTISLIWPLMLLITPFYFWRSPGHLFFTYVVPIVPFVLVFDGYVSSLRTRTTQEILGMIGDKDVVKDWKFRSGSECHTYPTGEMTWFIGIKNS